MRHSSKVRLHICLFLLLPCAVRAQTWNGWEKVEQQGPDATITFVQFSDDNNSGVIAGDAGFVRYTPDRGSHWYVPKSPFLSSAQFNEDIRAGTQYGRTYYLLAEQHLLRSKTNGEFWQVIERPLSLDLARDGTASGRFIEYYDIFFVSESEGWVLCGVLKNGKKNATFLRSYLLHTDNAGELWESKVLRAGQKMLRVHFTNNGRGWVVGDGGVILHTEDGGGTWTQQPSPVLARPKVPGSGRKLLDIDFKGKKGIIVGVLGTILHTEDGGQTWFLVLPSALPAGAGRRDLTCVQMMSENRAWAVGTSGSIFSTSDGGESWTAQNSPIQKNLFASFMQDRNQGWVAGDNKTLWRYDAHHDRGN